MTARDKATIKSYFQTGDRPTQTEFGDLIDSYADVSALAPVSALSEATGTGLLVRVSGAPQPTYVTRQITGAGPIAVSAGTGESANPQVQLVSAGVTSGYLAPDVTTLLALASSAMQPTDYPGAVVQSVTSASGAVASGTTTIPGDNTIPQITEGTQFLSVSITPLYSNSVLEIEIDAQLSASGTDKIIVGALFRDSTADALATAAVYDSGAVTDRIHISHRVSSGSTTATTLRFRAGTTIAGTTYLNSADNLGTAYFGSTLNSRITVREYKA